MEHAARQVLSDDRQMRAEQLHTQQQRQQFVTAEIVTQKLISRCFGIERPEIMGRASEKPYLKEPSNISFSRSYCGEGLVVALEENACIGVDSEPIKKADVDVMKYFFTEQERAFVQASSNPDLAFFLIWTRKESYIKCIGDGLNFPFHQLNVVPKQIQPEFSLLCEEVLQVDAHYIKSYLLDGVVVSACSENKAGFPSTIQEWREYEENDY